MESSEWKILERSKLESEILPPTPKTCLVGATTFRQCKNSANFVEQNV